MATLFPFLRSLLLSLALVSGEVFARPAPALWNVPVTHGPFWGRKAQLIELEQKLTKGPVVVTGLPGMGKSTLAFAYAKQHAQRYRVVWVFDASQGMDNQMIDFANKLHAYEHKGNMGSFSNKDEASHYIKTLLRTCAFSWLLIFHGADGIASLKAALPETHGQKGKDILVTSLSHKDATGVMRLDALTDGEAMTFLKHYLPTATQSDLAELARLLNNHPLALLQAAAYIKATPNMGVQAYVAFFTRNKKAYLDSEAKALAGQPLLSTAIQMSVDKLKAASEDGYTMLVALCLLNNTKIESSLIEKTYIQLNSGDMGGFGKIQDVALIAPMGDASYKIHDYVRDVVLMGADKQTLQKAANLDAQVFLSLFPEKIEDCVGVFEKNPELVEHVKALMTHGDLMAADDAFSVGLRLFYYGDAVLIDCPDIVKWADQLELLFESGKVADPYQKAVFKRFYGDTRVMTDGIDASLVQYRQAAPFFDQVDPQKIRIEHVAFLANNLGFFLHYKGELEEATQCLERAKQLQGAFKEIYPLSSMDELEISLDIDKGNPAKAVLVADRELKLLEQDPVFMKTAGHFVKSLKTCALLKQAQFQEISKNKKEAKELRHKALEVGKDAYNHAVKNSDGKDDTSAVARTLLYLSQAQSANGDFKKAHASAQKALIIFNKHYPNAMAHPRQAVAHMALGDALAGQGKFEEAEEAYRTSERIFKAISTHFVFDDMSEVLFKMFELGKAHKETLQGRVLMQHAFGNHLGRFGEDHPRQKAMKV